MVFEPGDRDTIHIRPRRLPVQKASELAPMSDGSVQAAERSFDKAYRLKLPGKYAMPRTSKVANLVCFGVGSALVLRSKPSQEGGNDGTRYAAQPIKRAEGPNRELDAPIHPMTSNQAGSFQYAFYRCNTKLIKPLDRLERAHGTWTQDMPRRPTGLSLASVPMLDSPPTEDTAQTDQLEQLEELKDIPEPVESVPKRFQPKILTNDRTTHREDPLAADQRLTMKNKGSTEENPSSKLRGSNLSQLISRIPKKTARTSPDTSWPILALNRPIIKNVLTVAHGT